jgi:hypothetical protein
MSSNAAIDFNAPDGIEPIVGWRMWILERNKCWWPRYVQVKDRYLRPDEWLRSLNGNVWVPGERMEAVCVLPGLVRILKHRHAPESTCHCGVYAFQSIDELMPMLHPPRLLPFRDPLREPVLGEVSLWGRIVVHQDGYRAQFAYPKRFWVDESSPEELKRALGTYGVPVATLQDVEFRQMVETRVDSMEPVMKDAAVAFLTGTDWLPPWCCPVCRNLMLFDVCPHCDPEAADREQDRLYEEMKCLIREARRQKFAWLYAPAQKLSSVIQDAKSIDMPPRLNSVDKAKLRTFVIAGGFTAALATLLLTEPTQGL